MIPLPELTTARLTLRAFRIEESPQVARLVNDPEITKDLRSFDSPYSVTDARNWLVRLPDDWEQGRSAVFAICLRHSSGLTTEKPRTLIGSIGMLLDRRSNRGEMGYWVGRDFQGNGFCQEAAVAVLDFAFNGLGLHKVTSECLARNPASARVLEKSGFTQEGFLKQHFRKHEHEPFADVQVFGLLKEQWNQRN